MLLEWTGALECSAKIECYFSFNCMTFYFSLINNKKKKNDKVHRWGPVWFSVFDSGLC